MSEPSVSVRPRTRIGDMGFPNKVWMVWEHAPGTTAFATGFYNPDRARAWAAASEHRHMRATPVTVKDASS